jgi:hypothetical protein
MKYIFNLLFILYFSISVLIAQKDVKSANFHQWAKTPPMGWNSWDCYGPTVVEQEVKANADYMSQYLKPYGWEYIIVDIRWYVGNDKAHGYNEKDAQYNIDEYGRLTPALNRFPSAADGKGFKPLADYIHSKGLKFGVHIMRGIPKIAVERNLPVFGTNVRAKDIYNTNNLCTWLGDMYTVDASKNGAQEYYNSLFQLYASWGLDFIKIDDLSSPFYHKDEIELIRKAIDHSGRKIVLSTSPGETPIEFAAHVKQTANMWRTVGDFWDNWPQLKEHFEVCKRWAPHITTGAWPDADMLPLGRIGIRAERGNNRMAKFTKDEQYTLMNLFSIFRSPLMFGGDLPSNDAFTLSLLTNKRVLYVLKNSCNNKELFNNNDLIAWVADDSKSGDKFVALFNAQDPKYIREELAIWSSGNITKNTPGQRSFVDLNIKGSGKIYLVVGDAKDNNAWDHADWINPCIYNAKDTIKLTSVKWNKASAGWGTVQTGKSVSEADLIVNNIKYDNGIGTHANSVIEYTLPEGYNRFCSFYGIDNAGARQNTGATVNFMIFTENPSGISPSDSSQITVTMEQLGLKEGCTIENLWTGEKLSVSKEFSPYIRRHASNIFRVSLLKSKTKK